jgi:hypothetical protein
MAGERGDRRGDAGAVLHAPRRRHRPRPRPLSREPLAFVVTVLEGGREGIFWQTAKTTRKTRPGMRLPTRRSAAGVLEIVVDTRERYAWKFERQQVTMLAAAQVRYPNVPIVLCENRQLAQEWAYRFLGAAVAYADEEATDLDQGFSRRREYERLPVRSTELN